MCAPRCATLHSERAHARSHRFLALIFSDILHPTPEVLAPSCPDPSSFSLSSRLNFGCGPLRLHQPLSDRRSAVNVMVMRFHFPILPLLALSLLIAPLAAAQDDPAPLGDVARNLRKNKAQQAEQQPQQQPQTTVIDNENLSQVMEDARKARPARPDKTVLSIDSSSNTVKLSAPDVTCSLSFNTRASSLIIRPVLVEDLPVADLLKLDGPGSIQDENLQIEVFNATEWDLREITIGLTLERRPGENAEMAARARVIPAAQTNAPVAVERRSDVTLLYHLKTAAKPFSKSAFRENIGITPGPDEDWRWSIIAAKGIRPVSAPASLRDPGPNSPQ
jgi:hypothetical protein